MGDVHNFTHPALTNGPVLEGSFQLTNNTPLGVELKLTSPKTEGYANVRWPLQSSTITVSAKFQPFDLDDVLAFSAKLSSLTLAVPLSAPDSKPSPSLVFDGKLQLRNVHTQWADADLLTSTMTYDTTGQALGSVEITNLAAEGEQFELVTTSVSYQQSELTLDPLRFSGLGGNGTVTVDLQPPDQHTKDAPAFDSFDVRWKINSIDALKLQNVAALKTRVVGRLNTSGSLNGPLNPFDWADVNGMIELDLSTGTITGMPGILKVFTDLNLHSLFRTFEKTNAPGLPFHLIKTTFSVTDGVFVTSAPFVMRSDTLNVFTKGSFSMVDKTMDLNVVVQPLTLLDEVLKAIPGVRTILLGHRQTLVPIYVTVKGPFENPKVDVQPMKSLGKTLWRTVVGVFKLPETVVQDIFDKPDKK